MKNISVKIKITVWLTLLMLLLAGLLLAFMLSISSTVAVQASMFQLSDALQQNLRQVGMSDGKLAFGDSFHFYQNGISTLVYSKNEALIAGQLPISFGTAEAFQNGLTRTVGAGDARYLVMDLWLPLSWDDGVWLRGLMEAPAHHRTARNLLRVALVTLPVFVLLAALGSYRIARRAFSPLDDITAAAEAINEARDLSGRIALPPGRDEFSRLAATFDGMFERLERSFEAEQRFTADASHELRTPVSIIKGACEYAERFDETPEERRETLAMIHRQADKMAALISRLLSMTRLDQGTELIRMEPVDLGALIRAVCQEQDFGGCRPVLELEDNVVADADPALLSQLVRNLLDNAVKYGGTTEPVRVALLQNEAEIRLSVKDGGDGIPAEQQEKIWERFYQADPSRSNSGVGLGLSMVRQIARLHGGHMTLESAPGEGSAFTLHLPVPQR